jgi:hypothetical protein
VEAIFERLKDGLNGGDDLELWWLAAKHATTDVAALDPSPRRVTLTFARVPRENSGAHPDDRATFSLSWEREKGSSDWRFVGEHPHLKRHRGTYSATICLPAGTTRLASVDAVMLWRPHRPWAPPTDTEIGRQIYRFRRDPESRWRSPTSGGAT